MDITKTINFFNLLFGRIPISHFSYLMIFSNGYGNTYPFAIADENQRKYMARKAIELSSKGFDVWHAVNPVCIEPTSNKRGDETTVSYQTAIVVDIDICSDAHKSDNLAQSFEEAKSFLPFTPSIIINSGYGLHAYYIWAEPLAITDQNRDEIKRRNNRLLDVVRQKANGKKIDGVGDLPRILRTPGTFNYKLGKENPPLCHIVEQNDLLFSPAQRHRLISIRCRCSLLAEEIEGGHRVQDCFINVSSLQPQLGISPLPLAPVLFPVILRYDGISIPVIGIRHSN